MTEFFWILKRSGRAKRNNSEAGIEKSNHWITPQKVASSSMISVLTGQQCFFVKQQKRINRVIASPHRFPRSVVAAKYICCCWRTRGRSCDHILTRSWLHTFSGREFQKWNGSILQSWENALYDIPRTQLYWSPLFTEQNRSWDSTRRATKKTPVPSSVAYT